MSAGRRDLFAVLHWTEPQLRSAPQWYIFAVLHLRSGTSSQCSSGQSHIPVVHLRSAPQWCIFAVVHLRSAPVDRATFQWYIFAVLRQSHIPVVHLHSAPFRLLFFFFFRLLFFFFFCQTSFLFLSFLSRYCHTRYCHIWVLGGHLILFILFCAWVLGDRFVTCAAAGGRITINQNEPNVVIRQSSIQYRTARSRRGMPRHATCQQQDTKLCCRCALPTMEEPWMQQRELDEVFGPKSMMHIEPRSVLLLVNH